MSRPSHSHSAETTSEEPRWVAGIRGHLDGGADAALVRERVAAAMFPEERPPLRVGRYLVLERVGTGGMGTVYAAYDPELERKVAIKILRTASGESQDALLREARVLAKLSHPHVVTVHDVGTFVLAGQRLMFVAMEFVAGTTLTKWLRDRKRSHREVVDLLLEAARGLAAAHEVAIIHGDFKPDNVLVDERGHAYVVDFGLSRASIEGEPNDGTRVDGGTPGYMAPEQLARRNSDVRIDQFAFCVTLWEALYGERPFEGATFVQTRANMQAGKRRPPPRGTEVPTWMRTAIERGLAIEPDDRWPTIQGLADALERGRARTRIIRGSIGLGVLAVVGSGVLAAQQIDEQRRIMRCEEAGAAIDEVWNDEEREAVRSALVATGVGHAVTTAEKVMPWLDARADAWKEARVEACLDANVREQWDAVLLERAEWCLEDRRLELDALVTELREVDARAVGEAVNAAASVRDVVPCRDAGLLDRMPAPPVDDADEVHAIQAEISRANALQATLAFEEGLEVARANLERAETVGWPPLIALARLEVGELLRTLGKADDAERIFESAYFEAARAGAHEVALSAALSLVAVVGYDLARYPDAERWAKLADLSREQLPDPGGLREADLVNMRGILREGTGDLQGALNNYAHALEVRQSALGPDHPHVAGMLENLAIARVRMGDFEAAEELEQRAIEVNRRAFGPDHPTVAGSLGILAAVRSSVGDYAGAKALSEQALAILERALGPEHPRVAAELDNIGIQLRAMGSPAEAIPLQRRALEIMERARGQDHPEVATVRLNLAGSLMLNEAYAEAIEVAEHALRSYEARLGPEHADVGLVLGLLGSAHESMGNYELASGLLERATRIGEKTHGPTHPDLAITLNNLGLVRHALGAHEEAAELHERALAMQEELLGSEHPDIAATLHDLASSRLALGDVAEAERHERRALSIWKNAGHPNVSKAHVALARVALVDGRRDEARALAERAVEVHAVAPPHERAEAWFVLARSLQGGHEAVALAVQARDAYRESTAAHRNALAEVEAWLQQHD